jgi:hypothetical protein
VFAILGEDKSDAATLKIIVRRFLADASIRIKQKGYHGCGDLCANGARPLRAFADQGATRFVVCHDADGPDPEPACKRVLEKVIAPAGLQESSCIVVPVQELEAWILADETAVRKVIPSFDLRATANPEQVPGPKEYLEDLSRTGRSRPLYIHAIHNERVAEHLDFDTLYKKCPSFRGLHEFVAKARP